MSTFQCCCVQLVCLELAPALDSSRRHSRTRGGREANGRGIRQLLNSQFRRPPQIPAKACPNIRAAGGTAAVLAPAILRPTSWLELTPAANLCGNQPEQYSRTVRGRGKRDSKCNSMTGSAGRSGCGKAGTLIAASRVAVAMWYGNAFVHKLVATVPECSSCHRPRFLCPTFCLALTPAVLVRKFGHGTWRTQILNFSNGSPEQYSCSVGGPGT